MRRLAALIPLVVLAACQAPREACLADASRELRIVERLIDETRGNIARGYAVEEEQRVRVRPGICRGTDEDGGVDLDSCEDVDVDMVARPVAVDLNAEAAKLDSLLERRERLAAEREARVGACAAAYPAA